MRAYDKSYLDCVMHNLAALFDIAINAEGFDPDEFGEMFASSRVAFGIEQGEPNYLAGKSATELLMEILNRDVEYMVIPMDRTRAYWAGWGLALAQWYINKPFKEILSKMPFGKIVSLYDPYHEADEMKTVECIQFQCLSKLAPPFSTSVEIGG